uniref:P-type phospholipid transporter n=1 Tax=Chromera velia CCMP2878 TaxID=1169474 RepID=A0A0G4FCQ6_9ALVE|eukprot:Cvel_16197.t1-p1 / transcript=Cvel_16197.t1 / gene=Cvel_16197 / organism=Chromera_velia_CCMP2878 / gene_product=Putative phospholipid-transporting ATPase 12, putative / transcript_product=Putative phospholipid-transporting ATPase 12, putative / location=Cvel_scaffold1237:3395-29098(-) / protein_length=2803 / sequence_SO=supercontig / SO=protein_coding / is_pseudo=false
MRRRQSQLNETIVVHRNDVRTTKYTLLTWIPTSLFYQFRRSANIYFLVITVLTFLPFSPKHPASQAATFGFVVLFAVLKDGYEDWRRRKQDQKENMARTRRYDFSSACWEDVPRASMRVGDLVLLRNDETVPADVLCLSSAEVDEGVAFIDTANLDGETNLKMKKAVTITHSEFLRLCGCPETSPSGFPAQPLPSIPEAHEVVVEGDAPGRQSPTGTGAGGEEEDVYHFHAPEWASPILLHAAGQLDYLVQAEQPHADVTVFKGSCVINPGLRSRANSHVSESLLAPKANGNQNSGGDKEVSLGAENLLYRGCVLRNTRWILGLVIYAGGETKIRMNSSEAPTKVSRVSRTMNELLGGIFCFLFGVCALYAVLSLLWEGVEGDRQWALHTGSSESPSGGVGILVFLIVRFFIFLIAISHLIPISLYVITEVLKLVLTFWINADPGMEAPDGTAAMARTSDLVEELGQAEFLFSDKTGTLTCNSMEFAKCHVGKKSFGPTAEAAQAAREKGEAKKGILGDETAAQLLASSATSHKEGDSGTSSLLAFPEGEEGTADSLLRFFVFLALCHAVLPESEEDRNSARAVEEEVGVAEGEKEEEDPFSFQGSSPDEVALVLAAARNGVVLLSRSKKRGSRWETLELDILRVRHLFDLHEVIEFSSDRKRMTTIVEHRGIKGSECAPGDGSVFCLTKGADSIMEGLLASSSPLKSDEKAALSEFSRKGLRTLVMAAKPLGKDEYREWSAASHAASVQIQGREKALEEVAKQMENNLRVVGLSAVEDRLQDDVPATIFKLKDAGLRVFVLTGDKLETAVDIGFSCQLLDRNMSLHIISQDTAKDSAEIMAKLKDVLRDAEARVPDFTKRPPQEVDLRDKAQSGRTCRIVDYVTLGLSACMCPPREKKSPIRQEFDKIQQQSHKHQGEPKRIGLAVDGKTLAKCLESDDIADIFLRVCLAVTSCLCCRLSPRQKALLVRLVRRGTGLITVAVGDGANDVPMIQEAHVGVGIRGKEGTQAVQSSDYAVPQFNCLQRLILVHGRKGYRRIASMICYYFYKNVVIVMCDLLFNVFAGFSGQIFFPEWLSTMYNAFFTSFACLFTYALDVDVPDEVALALPMLYLAGPRNVYFTGKVFWAFMVAAIYHGILVPILRVLHSVRPGGLVQIDSPDLLMVVASVVPDFVVDRLRLAFFPNPLDIAMYASRTGTIEALVERCGPKEETSPKNESTNDPSFPVSGSPPTSPGLPSGTSPLSGPPHSTPAEEEGDGAAEADRMERGESPQGVWHDNVNTNGNVEGPTEGEEARQGQQVEEEEGQSEAAPSSNAHSRRGNREETEKKAENQSGGEDRDAPPPVVHAAWNGESDVHPPSPPPAQNEKEGQGEEEDPSRLGKRGVTHDNVTEMMPKVNVSLPGAVSSVSGMAQSNNLEEEEKEEPAVSTTGRRVSAVESTPEELIISSESRVAEANEAAEVAEQLEEMPESSTPLIAVRGKKIRPRGVVGPRVSSSPVVPLEGKKGERGEIPTGERTLSAPPRPWEATLAAPVQARSLLPPLERQKEKERQKVNAFSFLPPPISPPRTKMSEGPSTAAPPSNGMAGLRVDPFLKARKQNTSVDVSAGCNSAEGVGGTKEREQTALMIAWADPARDLIVVSFLVCGGLAPGLLFAQSPHSWEHSYGSSNGRVREDLKVYQATFREYGDWFTVMVSAREGVNLVDADVMRELQNVDTRIRSTRIRMLSTGNVFRYSDICKMNGDGVCDFMAVPRLFSSPSSFGPGNLTFPRVLFDSHGAVREVPDLRTFLDGVDAREGRLWGATLMVWQYSLQAGEGDFESGRWKREEMDEPTRRYRIPTGPTEPRNATREEVQAWMKGMEEELDHPEFKENPHFSLAIYSSRSIDDALQAAQNALFAPRDLILFGIVVFLVALYAALLNLSKRLEEWRLLSALTGCLTPVLAYLGSSGLLYLCGLPHESPNLAVPFLVLGIGVDDFFVILSAVSMTWGDARTLRRVREGKDCAYPRERLGHAMREAGISVTLTTATNLIGLLFGLNSNVFAIRNFCVFMVMGLLFGYVMCLSFFLGFLGLDLKREAAGERGYLGVFARVWRMLLHPLESQSTRDRVEREKKATTQQKEESRRDSRRMSTAADLPSETLDLAHPPGEESEVPLNPLTDIQKEETSDIARKEKKRASTVRPDPQANEPPSPDFHQTPPTREARQLDASDVCPDQKQEQEHETEEEPIRTRRQTDAGLAKESAPPSAVSPPPPSSLLATRDLLYLHLATEQIRRATRWAAVVPFADSTLRGAAQRREMTRMSPQNKQKQTLNKSHRTSAEGDSPAGETESEFQREEEGEEEDDFCLLQISSPKEGNVLVRAADASESVSFGRDNVQMAVFRFVQNCWARLLLHPLVVAVVLLSWLALIGLSVASLSSQSPVLGGGLKFGLHPVELTNTDAPLRVFFRRYSVMKNSGYSGQVFFDRGAEWWRTEVQEQVIEFVDQLETQEFYRLARPPMYAFLKERGAELQEKWPNDREQFETALGEWLEGNRYFKWDFAWQDPVKKRGLESWRFVMIESFCETTHCYRGNMVGSREFFKRFEDFFVARYFHEIFLTAELDLSILRSTLLSMGGVLVAATFMSSLLLKGLWAVVFVVVCVAAIDISLFGVMVWWGIPLSLLSAIILVLCAGFAVDYVVHICHAFTGACGERRPSRVVESLVALGPAVFHGALTVVLAGSPALFTKSAMFLLFFQMIAVAIALALTHGILVLPVLLRVAGPIRATREAEKARGEAAHKLVMRLREDRKQVVLMEAGDVQERGGAAGLFPHD